MYTVMMIFALFPLLHILFSLKNYRHRKILLIVSVPAFILWLSLLSFPVINGIFYWEKYGLPIFSQGNDAVFLNVAIGFVFGLILLIVLVISIASRRTKMSNGKRTFIVTALLCIHIFFVFHFYMPLEGKVVYAEAIDRSNQLLDYEGDLREVSVVHAHQGKVCQDDDCSEYQFDQLFMVKNNQNRSVNVQLKIELFDHDDKKFKTIVSNYIKLKPQESKAVTTKDSVVNGSPWDTWTLNTDEFVKRFNYSYRFAD